MQSQRISAGPPCTSASTMMQSSPRRHPTFSFEYLTFNNLSTTKN